MRAFLTGCALVALAACQPAIPDSAAGVGFDNANLSPRPAPNNDTVTAALPPASSVSGERLDAPAGQAVGAPMATTALAATPSAQTRPTQARPTPQPGSEATAAAAAALGALEAQEAGEPAAPRVRAPGQAQTTPDGIVHASPSNPAPTLMDNPGISDENDFEAVGSRRSIQDDAARLQANRDSYQVIQPTAVPKRTDTGPNIVAYALSLTHPVGTKMYRRINLLPKSHTAKACAGFPSSNDAQAAFLASGGPKRDRKGLDPDGDGYACGWNPEPYRRAARGG
ncbi:MULTISPECIES: hypothetical protein [Shimia]|uniref:hypothetical protein n=1 Tax=Shimia TaxID=573139 RepID=UPI001FB4001B|nr:MULTISPECIES: hypothetical protein [Shimia]MDV4146041.1 hypothetical protein [Shimia sp. FJ5]